MLCEKPVRQNSTLPSVGGVVSSDMSRAVAARSRAPGTEIHAVTAQRWKKTEP